MAAISPIIVLDGTLPTGDSTFGPFTPSLGADFVELAVSRAGFALKSQPFNWSIEISIDAGRTWVFGGSGGTVAGTLLTSAGIDGKGLQVVLIESAFGVPIPKTDANSRIRGKLSLPEGVVTVVTLRQEERVAVALDPIIPHASVSIADISSVSATGTGVSTVTTGSMTITSNANRAGAVLVAWSANNQTGITASIGGTSSAAVTNTDSGTSLGYRNLIHGVTAPPSGSQTATISWTNACNALVYAVATSGVDQTTPLNNGTFAFHASNATPTRTVTSNSGDLTIDVECESSGNFPTPTQTQLAVLKVNTGNVISGGASRGPGTAGPITHAWTVGSGGSAWIISAANFNQAAAVDKTPYDIEHSYQHQQLVAQ